MGTLASATGSVVVVTGSVVGASATGSTVVVAVALGALNPTASYIEEYWVKNVSNHFLYSGSLLYRST